MSPRSRISLVVGGLLSALSILPLAAQTGGTVPPLLLLPGGTRAMGLGGAYYAGDGPEVVFYNPAQLGTARGTAFSYHRVDRSSTLASMATGTTLLGASIGAGVQYLEYRGNRWQGPTDIWYWGEVISSIEATLGASLERKGIRVGMAAKYAQQHSGAGLASQPALELGGATQISGITVAIAVTDGNAFNPARSMHGVRLPTQMSVGVASGNRTLGTWFDIAGMASVSVEEGGHFLPAGGIEVSYFPVSGWSIVARVGAHERSHLGTPRESNFSAGATVSADRLAVDYAFQPSRLGSGAGHRLGIRIRP